MKRPEQRAIIAWRDAVASGDTAAIASAEQRLHDLAHQYSDPNPTLRVTHTPETRRIREQARLTLAQAAAEVGVDKMTLSRWERGLSHCIDYSMLRRYQDCLSRWQHMARTA